MPDFPRAIRGYHRDQVDALIARIEGTLGRAPLYAPPVTVKDIGDVRFTIVLRGYEAKAVDRALDGYLKELETKNGRHRIRGADTDRLIGLVRNVRFPTTRLKEGYDEREVDEFLDAAIVELRRGRARASQMRGVRFATTRMRPGYRPADVDAFLERLASEIERLRSGD
jgi:DivIVA domain-containing protein